MDERSKEKLKRALEAAETVIVGAGAGLSASAGYTYDGERFRRYFPDFERKYGFHDMYSGGFTRFGKQEILWAFWSRNIYINRYMPPPKPVYEKLLELVKDKDFFVITTNVDHCFQRAGFDKRRLFYTQGDYGLWQCSKPCRQRTYDNAEAVREMVEDQGFTVAENGDLVPPEASELKLEVSSGLVPRCPVCGRPMTMNLRVDDRFAEDEGWRQASARYADFLRRHEHTKTLFLELGVGFNTPGIMKYPFWRMTRDWPDALYACLNYGEAAAPAEIGERSICLNGDIGELLEQL